MSTGILPKFRERVGELRKRIGERRILGERAQIQIGKGALIERARKRLTQTTERIQELKPGIIPKMGQLLSEWYPGKRLVEVITPKTELVKPGELTMTPAKEEVKPPAKTGMHY